MKIIGLCGGSGSGKGTVANFFMSSGIPVIDTDAVYHQLTASDSDCLRELVSCFGGQILSPSGALDRSVLARIVFKNGSNDKLEKLNKIAHKHILARVRDMLSDFSLSGYDYAVVDAPLLYESGFDKECDFIIAVVAQRDVRIRRIISRDSITEKQAEQRIDSQISDSVLKERADYVVENNGTLSDLEHSVINVINQLRNK